MDSIKEQEINMNIEQSSNLYVNFVKVNEKSVKILSSGTKKDFDKEVKYTIEGLCVKEAFEIAKTLEKGDAIKIKAGDVRPRLVNGEARLEVIIYALDIVKRAETTTEETTQDSRMINPDDFKDSVEDNPF